MEILDLSKFTLPNLIQLDIQVNNEIEKRSKTKRVLYLYVKLHLREQGLRMFDKEIYNIVSSYGSIDTIIQDHSGGYKIKTHHEYIIIYHDELYTVDAFNDLDEQYFIGSFLRCKLIEMRTDYNFDNIKKSKALHIYFMLSENSLTRLDNNVEMKTQQYGPINAIIYNHSCVKNTKLMMHHEYIILYDDERDANDALKSLDNKYIEGVLWKCKLMNVN